MVRLREMCCHPARRENPILAARARPGLKPHLRLAVQLGTPGKLGKPELGKLAEPGWLGESGASFDS